ncbi:helix-turn-helix transcriptional regulator [Pseudoalteromonas sp. S2755]|uniref:helix-turn-helix domain-containing protein n=1 Tax=Pseudoalteromonas sp. S2755 TaxID=2066523 RepID=UPI00110ACDF8|nr:helix-turn-helix transcriptional regulator [Pseudoalteromonas sp. S2755]TMN38832.1 hypothetical protein CWC03_10820 [Pseudoalteromonas sp. S2755]
MSTPNWVSVANELMKEQKVYQKDLLEVFNVNSTSAVSHYFSGRNSISSEQLSKLANRLGVPVSKLLNEEVSYGKLHVQTLVDTLQTLVRIDKLPDTKIVTFFETLESLGLDRISEVYDVLLEANLQRDKVIQDASDRLKAQSNR